MGLEASPREGPQLPPCPPPFLCVLSLLKTMCDPVQHSRGAAQSCYWVLLWWNSRGLKGGSGWGKVLKSESWHVRKVQILGKGLSSVPLLKSMPPSHILQITSCKASTNMPFVFRGKDSLQSIVNHKITTFLTWYLPFHGELSWVQANKRDCSHTWLLFLFRKISTAPCLSKSILLGTKEVWKKVAGLVSIAQLSTPMHFWATSSSSSTILEWQSCGCTHPVDLPQIAVLETSKLDY